MLFGYRASGTYLKLSVNLRFESALRRSCNLSVSRNALSNTGKVHPKRTPYLSSLELRYSEQKGAQHTPKDNSAKPFFYFHQATQRNSI
jgi:hypothetical protein